jgi:hypothetical protein
VANRQDEYRRYALVGAEQELARINGEAQAILRAFPELRRRGGGVAAPGRDGARSADGNGSEEVPTKKRRRRRKMSAEARKRISDAQKARWARQRGEGGAKAQKRAAARA